MGRADVNRVAERRESYPLRRPRGRHLQDGATELTVEKIHRVAAERTSPAGRCRALDGECIGVPRLVGGGALRAGHVTDPGTVVTITSGISARQLAEHQAIAT